MPRLALVTSHRILSHHKSSLHSFASSSFYFHFFSVASVRVSIAFTFSLMLLFHSNACSFVFSFCLCIALYLSLASFFLSPFFLPSHLLCFFPPSHLILSPSFCPTFSHSVLISSPPPLSVTLHTLYPFPFCLFLSSIPSFFYFSHSSFLQLVLSSVHSCWLNNT